MRLITTAIYEQLAEAWLDRKRHIWVEGGTAASKTFSILQLLILIARSAKSPLLISIASESIPHIKRGCLRDFRRILDDTFEEGRFNKTDLVYRFSQAQIEFFSADDSSKQRGARRDVLFLNEVNNIAYDAFRELDVRTRICTFADWNPVSEFFFHEQKLRDEDGSSYIHATYKDAESVIPPEVVANIVSMGERDPNWWNVYGLGRVGKIEGLVYPYFDQVEALPIGGDVTYGLDFGYSNDFTVLTKNVIFEEKKLAYSQELIYEIGLTNAQIARTMEEKGVLKHKDVIIADSAEPKSIKEISEFGFNIKACIKGSDSVEYGHQKLRQYKQHWTKDSLNCIKEQRNFRYIPDKDGKFTEKTTHRYSHGMDSRRYAMIGSICALPLMIG